MFNQLNPTLPVASYPAAMRDLGCKDRHRPGRLRDNNRVENSHLVIRRRERKQQKFKAQGSAQRFLSTHSAVYNVFNAQPHLIRRTTLRLFRAQAHKTWAAATAAARVRSWGRGFRALPSST